MGEVLLARLSFCVTVCVACGSSLSVFPFCSSLPVLVLIVISVAWSSRFSGESGHRVLCSRATVLCARPSDGGGFLKCPWHLSVMDPGSSVIVESVDFPGPVYFVAAR